MTTFNQNYLVFFFLLHRDYDQCLSVSHIPVQYCLLDFAVPMPTPMPRFHNYYHQAADVLPPPQSAAAAAVFSTSTSPSVSSSSKANNSSSINGTTEAAHQHQQQQNLSPFLAADSVYRSLERQASVFYYVYIQIGVCLPADCSREDVANISAQGKARLMMVTWYSRIVVVSAHKHL